MPVPALVWQALIVIAMIFLLGLVQRLFSNKANATQRIQAAIGTLTPAAWNFVATEYNLGFLNRTYLVFVTRDMLVDIRVRGPMSAPMLVTQRHHDPYFYPNPKKIEQYAQANLEAPSMLKGANFQIPKRDIARVEFTTAPKWGMGSVPYSGRILLHLQNRTRRELILLGDQDGNALQAKFSGTSA